jgi:hypothetical protein
MPPGGAPRTAPEHKPRSHRCNPPAQRRLHRKKHPNYCGHSLRFGVIASAQIGCPAGARCRKSGRRSASLHAELGAAARGAGVRFAASGGGARALSQDGASAVSGLSLMGAEGWRGCLSPEATRISTTGRRSFARIVLPRCRGDVGQRMGGHSGPGSALNRRAIIPLHSRSPPIRIPKRRI